MTSKNIRGLEGVPETPSYIKKKRGKKNMIIIKASTKRGQEIIKRFESLKGTELYHVYKNMSDDFIKAYNKRRAQFAQDFEDFEDAFSWHVSTHNSSYSWTCGWKIRHKGHTAIKLVTRDNCYIVWID